MMARRQLDAELDRLAGMLPLWCEHLRHPAQFWPQFDALAKEILDHAGPDERPCAQRRLDAMLEKNGLRRPAGLAD